MSVAENIRNLRRSLPARVEMVAVSKTQPVTVIREAYDAGQRIFGENKVQELVAKRPSLPSDIEWHFIGHLQSNKIRQIAPFITLIHSIDSLSLLKAVDREAGKNRRRIDCLLQFHIATEETKFGLSACEARELLSSPEFRTLEHIRITGVMGMNSFTGDSGLIRQECRQLAVYFREFRDEFFPGEGSFRTVSMGMSGDYLIAVEEGSTLVRLGTILFGNRYPGGGIG